MNIDRANGSLIPGSHDFILEVGRVGNRLSNGRALSKLEPLKLMQHTEVRPAAFLGSVFQLRQGREKVTPGDGSTGASNGPPGEVGEFAQQVGIDFLGSYHAKLS